MGDLDPAARPGAGGPWCSEFGRYATMHEFSIVQQLVNTAVESAKENNVKEVHSITLQLGELTFLGKEQMSFAFEVLTRDTILAGAELKFEDVPAEIECKECEYHGPLPRDKLDGLDHYFPILACPECGAKPEVVAGKECVIREMSAEV